MSNVEAEDKPRQKTEKEEKLEINMQQQKGLMNCVGGDDRKREIRQGKGEVEGNVAITIMSTKMKTTSAVISLIYAHTRLNHENCCFISKDDFII